MSKVALGGIALLIALFVSSLVAKPGDPGYVTTDQAYNSTHSDAGFGGGLLDKCVIFCGDKADYSSDSSDSGSEKSFGDKLKDIGMIILGIFAVIIFIAMGGLRLLLGLAGMQKGVSSDVYLDKNAYRDHLQGRNDR